MNNKTYYAELRYIDDISEVNRFQYNYTTDKNKAVKTLINDCSVLNPTCMYNKNICEQHKSWIIYEDSKYIVTYADIFQDSINVLQKMSESEFKEADERQNGMLTELLKETI